MIAAHVRELWRHRALVDGLVRREVAARYRRSVLGFAWTLLHPILLLLVYRLVFTRLTRAVDLPDYEIFFFVGILPWLWHATTLSNAATSLVANAGLVTRACMPPHVLPAVSVLSNLVNLLFALPVAVAAAAWEGRAPSAALALLPVVVLVHALFLYGAGLVLATLASTWRDVQFLLQNLLLVWFLGTPIAYPLDAVPEAHRSLLAWNPATALILPYQAILYHGRSPDPAHLAAGAAWGVVLVLAGVAVYEARRSRIVEEL